MADGQITQERRAGMSEVLEGCAMCCEGIRREAKEAGLPDDQLRRLDEAISICRDVANRLGR